MKRLINACHKPNHSASVCQAKKREVYAVDQKGTSDEQAFFIGALSRNKCTENDKRRSTYPSRLTMQLTVMSSRQKAFVRKWVLFVAVKKGQNFLPIPVMKTLGKSDVAVEY